MRTSFLTSDFVGTVTAVDDAKARLWSTGRSEPHRDASSVLQLGTIADLLLPTLIRLDECRPLCTS